MKIDYKKFRNAFIKDNCGHGTEIFKEYFWYYKQLINGIEFGIFVKKDKTFRNCIVAYFTLYADGNFTIKPEFRAGKTFKTENAEVLLNLWNDYIMKLYEFIYKSDLFIKENK